jgi:putative ABC transport system permease protein
MRIAEYWRRLWLLLRRDRATAELEAEMRLHRELRAQSMRTRGISEPEAATAARRRFGNSLLIQEASRDAWGLGSIDNLRQDVRYAVRRLRQRPGFAFAVVSILAVGVGATTAMFSAVDAAMFRPLPFPQPQELVALRDIRIPTDNARLETGGGPARIPNIRDALAMSNVFSHVAAYASGGLNLADPETPERVKTGVVTGDFFATLGVMPMRGHTFSADEVAPNGPAAVILSYGLWQRQFGGRDMGNRTILLNSRPYAVVGVMPQGFSFPDESDLWIPMSVPITGRTFVAFRSFLPEHIIARLAPGSSVGAAARQLQLRWDQASAAQIRQPDHRTSLDFRIDDIRQRGAAVPLQQELGGDRRSALIILLGATGLVMLIVSANVANLLLVQATSRRRELAVREALGASRGRLVRQLLTESTALAIVGPACGLAIAHLALQLLGALMPAQLAGIAPARIDLRVWCFTVTLAVLTGIGFGLWPAFAATRSPPGEIIKSAGGHGLTHGRAAGTARRVLVAAELALALMLLVGAGLMLKSLRTLTGKELGMETEDAGTLRVTFPQSAMSIALREQRIEEILARIIAIPGIAAAGAVNDLPLADNGLLFGLSIDGAAADQHHDSPSAHYLVASDGYFPALGIALRRGRLFTAADDSLAPHVAIVSASLARKGWPGTDPIGRTFRLERDPDPMTVVGVVADVRDEALDRDPLPQVYVPMRQATPSTVAIVARGSLPAASLLTALGDAVRAVDPAQAISDLRTMREVVSGVVAPRRTSTVLIAIFAALALMLSVFGVYSIVAFSVEQRARECAIRTALGASGRDLVALIARETLWVVVAGLGAGLAGAWALARVVESLLYGVTMHDPATFIVVPFVLLVATAAATVIPALRVLRVNPADVMRTD